METPQTAPANGVAPDAVQPTGAPEGQPGGQGGAEDQGLGLYDLSAAPPELRPYLEQELKKVEGNVTKKFEEHKQYRDQWQPFEQLGLNEMQPEQVEQLLAFQSLLENPQQVKTMVQDQDRFEDWWESIGEEMGFFADDGEPGQPGEPAEQNPEVQALQQEIAELREQLGPLQQHALTQEQEQRLQAANAQIDEDMAKLKADHPEVEFNEDVEQAIYKLALAHDGDDDLQKAFADYMNITGGAQRQLVQGAERQPEPPEGPGSPPASDDAPHSFDDAKKAAKARFAAVR